MIKCESHVHFQENKPCQSWKHPERQDSMSVLGKENFETVLTGKLELPAIKCLNRHLQINVF